MKILVLRMKNSFYFADLFWCHWSSNWWYTSLVSRCPIFIIIIFMIIVFFCYRKGSENYLLKCLMLFSYGFGAYFTILPGSEWSALMLTYGFPLAVIGMALKVSHHSSSIKECLTQNLCYSYINFLIVDCPAFT